MHLMEVSRPAVQGVGQGSPLLALHGGWGARAVRGGLERELTVGPGVSSDWEGRAVLFVHKGNRLLAAPKSY